jgi:hypothetical protein
MRSALLSIAFAVCVAAGLPADARQPSAPGGYVPMFNGRDLSGWVNVNTHPSTFRWQDGEVITTGKPMGFLRTEKQYENFELEMEWMHVNKTEVGNSGLFVWGDPLPAVGTVYTRGIEVQVLVNLEYKDKKSGKVTASSHGDLFSIWGADCTPDRPHPTGAKRCIPSENRAKGGGEWNHYKVIANDGVIKLHVNGKEVSGVSKCTPRKGYLALESEGAECHFKNLKIKELPSTNPKPEECAKVWEGHVSIFNALDLAGWKTEAGAWTVAGGHLKAAKDGELMTEKKYGPCELVFDWKQPAKSAGSLSAVAGPVSVTLGPTGSLQYAMGMTVGLGETKAIKPGAWNRAVVGYDGRVFTVSVNGQQAIREAVGKPLAAAEVRFYPPADGVEITNVFVRELKGK